MNVNDEKWHTSHQAESILLLLTTWVKPTKNWINEIRHIRYIRYIRYDILDIILDIIRPSPGFTWTTAPRIGGPEAPEAGPLTFSFDAMKRSSLQREAPGWPSELVEDLSRWPLKGPGTVAWGGW